MATTPQVVLSTTGSANNIGDLGHTPSALQVLLRNPDAAEVILWPKRPFNEAELGMLGKEFPDLRIVNGELSRDGVPSTPELGAALCDADLLVHGSGPSLLRAREVAGWRRLTAKPYGFFGVTVDPFLPSATTTRADGSPLTDGASLPELRREIDLLAGADRLPDWHREIVDHAAFLYTRDSSSLAYLQGQRVTPGVLELGADAMFGYDQLDEGYADELWAGHQLSGSPVVCVVPRLRFAPYHRWHTGPPTAEEQRKTQQSELHQEQDLAPLVATISALVEQAGATVLLCPEMAHEIETSERLVLPKLPAAVAGSVISIDQYWLPDQAAAVFRRSAGIISMHCHSPVIGSRHGVPAIYYRLPTETVKGQMWHDYGWSSGVIESVDLPGSTSLADAALAMLADRDRQSVRMAGLSVKTRDRLDDMAGTVWRTARQSAAGNSHRIHNH